MRCKINGKTCFVYIKEQEVEWEIEGVIYCWKGWQYKKIKLFVYSYVHKMWWRNNQIFIFHEKKIYHNKSRLHPSWSQWKEDIRRLKLIASIKDPCPIQKKMEKDKCRYISKCTALKNFLKYEKKINEIEGIKFNACTFKKGFDLTKRNHSFYSKQHWEK